MRPIKIILLSIIFSLMTSCGGSSTNEQQISSDQQISVNETDKPEKVYLTSFSKEDVARYAISSIMGQPSKKINVRVEDGLYYVSYIRKSDSKKFEYKINIYGNTIVWANLGGRWRDSEYDETINFEENDNKLKIIQHFSDGSVGSTEYKKGE